MVYQRDFDLATNPRERGNLRTHRQLPVSGAPLVQRFEYASGFGTGERPPLAPLFNFGFFNDNTWDFSSKQWQTQLIPGIVAVIGGFMLMTPSRGGGALGALLAFAAGGWLIVVPILYPLWSSGTIHPYGSEGMQALRWLGHFYGPGGLLIYFAGYAHGLFSRRTVVQDTQVVAEPQTQRTVTSDA
jgi:hypothetical protein